MVGWNTSARKFPQPTAPGGVLHPTPPFSYLHPCRIRVEWSDALHHLTPVNRFHTTRSTVLCYLCGEPLADEVDRDHVPPQMFFARPLRQQHNMGLATLPTHVKCNRSYRTDEEYFAYTVSPLAMDSVSGRAMTEEMGRRFREGRNQPLALSVLREFEDRPSGLYLPSGKIIKRLNAARVNRILWKITRGLFCLERREVLPETISRAVSIYGPDDEFPNRYDLVLVEPSRGKYPGAFDYKYKVMELGETRLALWAMLFWDRVIAFVAFHDLDCRCVECTDSAPATPRA